MIDIGKLPIPLRRLLEELGRCAIHVDLPTWAIRYLVARGIRTVADLPVIDGTILSKPSAEDGKLIHARIQSEFQNAYGPASRLRHDVVIERTAYLVPGVTCQLYEAARYRPGDLTIPVLAEALTTVGRQRTGALETDLVDISSLAIWEIKPFGSLEDAVQQILRYKTRFDCTIAGFSSLKFGASPTLTPGIDVGAYVLRPFLLAPSDVEVNRLRLVLPFEIIALPGVISYLVYNLPRPEELAGVAAADLLRRMLRELRHRGRRTFDPEFATNPTLVGEVPAWVGYGCLAIGAAILAGLAVAALPEAAASALATPALARLASVGLALLPAVARASESWQGDVESSIERTVGEPVPVETMAVRTSYGTLPFSTPQELVVGLHLVIALSTVLLGPPEQTN